jgi:hypothetical protein
MYSTLARLAPLRMRMELTHIASSCRSANRYLNGGIQFC